MQNSVVMSSGMREVITVSLGGHGLKMSELFWKNLAAEHKLDPTGQYIGDNEDELLMMGSYFREKLDGSFTPRCVFADLESLTADGIWMRDMAGLFDPSGFVIGKDNGDKSIHSSAYHVFGPQISRRVMDQIRKQFETSDQAEMLAYQHDATESTGSGLGSLILQLGYDLIQQAEQITYTVCPDLDQLENTTDGINNLLVTPAIHEYASACVLFGGRVHISDIAHSIAQITSCERLPGENAGCTKLPNLVLFPGLHYLVTSVRRRRSRKIIQYEDDFGTDAGHHGVTFLYNTLKRGCRYSLPGVDSAKCMTSNVTVRSSKLRWLQCQTACAYRQLMAPDRYVEWIPNNFSVSHCRVENLDGLTSVSIIENSSCVGDQMSHFKKMIDSIRKTKSYLHIYAQYGFQMAELDEAEASIETIVEGYKDVLIDKSPPPPPPPAPSSNAE
jgi:tubulin beta